MFLAREILLILLILPIFATKIIINPKIIDYCMKKILLFVMLFMGGCNYVSGQNQIPMHIIDETPIGVENPLASPCPWYINQFDYVFTMPIFAENFTLQLRDTNGTVVYFTFIPAGTTQFVLPSTLSGDYVILFIPSSTLSYYYRGYLTL